VTCLSQPPLPLIGSKSQISLFDRERRNSWVILSEFQFRVIAITFSKSSSLFSHELFANPSSKYRRAPLWSWNTKLDRDRLLRQIDHLADMGMGGFHTNSRTGLDTEYLGTEFLQLAKECVVKAKEKSMLAWLYDEDRWPSGYGGGKVLKERPDFQAQHLLLTRRPYGSFDLPRLELNDPY